MFGLKKKDKANRKLQDEIVAAVTLSFVDNKLPFTVDYSDDKTDVIFTSKTYMVKVFPNGRTFENPI